LNNTNGGGFIWKGGATLRNPHALVARILLGGILPGAHSLVSKVQAEGTALLIGGAFTYQGRLSKQGLPLTASADFVFTLKDAGKGGDTVASSISIENVSVVEGLFTLDLDFGVTAFNGDERWLEIQVRDPSGFGSFTTLSPRQPVRPAPYALQTRGVFVDEGGKVGIGTTEPAARLDVSGSPGVDGIRFPDGTTQTTALVGGGVPSGYLIASDTPDAPLGFTYSGLKLQHEAWINRADLPSARVNLPAEAVNGKVLAIGGATDNGPISTVEEYDPTRGTWQEETQIPPPMRLGCSSASPWVPRVPDWGSHQIACRDR